MRLFLNQLKLPYSPFNISFHSKVSKLSNTLWLLGGLPLRPLLRQCFTFPLLGSRLQLRLPPRRRDTSRLKQWSASPTTCGSAERSGSAAAAAAWGAAAAGAAGPCGASRSGPPSPPALWGCSGPPASRCPWPPSAAPPLSRGARLPRSARGGGGGRQNFNGSWFYCDIKIVTPLRRKRKLPPFLMPCDIKLKWASSRSYSALSAVFLLPVQHFDLRWLLTHTSN